MIKKIKSIKKFGVFQNFDWNTEVCDESGSPRDLQHINIIYGRNYSGKTTLSRILRAMETGDISDKVEAPEFSVALADGSIVTQETLRGHNKAIRVFNDDFVRDNLRFITNPDDNIEPFAILGDDNNKIEQEIKTLEAELGSKEEGNESGLYAQRAAANTAQINADRIYRKAVTNLDKQLKDKATSQKIGIKYNPERFGDQNYNIKKLKAEIEKVLSPEYNQPNPEELTQSEKLILEQTLPPIETFHAPALNFEVLVKDTELLVTKKISDSDKIEELVKDAVLNRWVNDGRTHHKGKRKECAFCGNPISEKRWQELDKHFDEESERLEKDINALIIRIESEKKTINAALHIDKSHFYSKFHSLLDEVDSTLKESITQYNQSLNGLIAQLKARKEDILNPIEFKAHAAPSAEIETAWGEYKLTCTASNSFTTSLNTEQKHAKVALRLKEVSDYLITIGYSEQQSSIKELKEKLEKANENKKQVEGLIISREELVSSKKRELNDEEKGAKKVNEYLNNFFGHRFLTLEAKQDTISGAESKRIRFEVIRNGKKAYHLSEGECSLLAFCYFLAKLDDIDTRDSKPIIWIDDPISSLDGNHIFFIYSLLNAEIVSEDKFEQLFISTHNLDFLKYLKRLNGKFLNHNGKMQDYQKAYFIISRQDKTSIIGPMPKYLKEYVTEFNYLFKQIHRCAAIQAVDDSNYVTFCNFANNARKFFEIYLYYKYPDQGMNEHTLCLFFGESKVPAVLTDRINNEYSHLCAVFERGATPVEVPEMQTSAQQIIERLKEDSEQYSALLKSVGIEEIIEEAAEA
ncbi:AAA family ATPase [Maridesulfovibrio sp.]|uniref:AAA family ATPase n=1 Tax=Maridesulfovibrio sp. TaxID=2795000 RepID=UPI0029C9E318|nr:AAA family ATPase [Maridesulfovibrio sp.]